RLRWSSFCPSSLSVVDIVPPDTCSLCVRQPMLLGRRALAATRRCLYEFSLSGASPRSHHCQDKVQPRRPSDGRWETDPYWPQFQPRESWLPVDRYRGCCPRARQPFVSGLWRAADCLSIRPTYHRLEVQKVPPEPV